MKERGSEAADERREGRRKEEKQEVKILDKGNR